jgi:glycosyltransferase involved in cell wall biosynthesis/predicted O-methyltransferase YrrM
MLVEKSFQIPYTGRNGIISALSKLIYQKDPMIVEIGMQRANSPDGDGNSTTVFDSFLSMYGGTLHSVDVDQRCIDLCQSELIRLGTMTDSVHLHRDDGIAFLETFNEPIDLLYLDAWDYCGSEDDLKRSEINHLKAMIAAERTLADGALVLIDDIHNNVTYVGKGALVIPYLLQKDYIVRLNAYQMILEKPKDREIIPGKVSFVCTTYRRYRCVERIIEQFLQQDYTNSELIIFNTDMQNQLVLDESLNDGRIIVVNNDLDYRTAKPYTNRGAICRDAIIHASGEYFMLADDDDVYLPWHIRQAVEKITEVSKDAWKPKKSFFARPDHMELAQNTMEASVITKMNRIREIGFRTDISGYEGLSWYTKLRDDGQLNEHYDNCIPSYCFNWSDPHDLAGHKQSGDINNPNNFENHKLASSDISRKPINRCGQDEIARFYSKYYAFLRDNRSMFPEEMWQRYINPYVTTE